MGQTAEARRHTELAVAAPGLLALERMWGGGVGGLVGGAWSHIGLVCSGADGGSWSRAQLTSSVGHGRGGGEGRPSNGATCWGELELCWPHQH